MILQIALLRLGALRHLQRCIANESTLRGPRAFCREDGGLPIYCRETWGWDDGTWDAKKSMLEYLQIIKSVVPLCGVMRIQRI